MHDMIVTILTYLGAILVGLVIGYFKAWVFDWFRARKRPSPLSDENFWLIHAWTHRNGWYHSNSVLRQFAADEHERLTRDEPKLTLEENLEKVARATREKYPAAFVTLH